MHRNPYYSWLIRKTSGFRETAHTSQFTALKLFICFQLTYELINKTTRTLPSMLSPSATTKRTTKSNLNTIRLPLVTRNEISIFGQLWYSFEKFLRVPSWRVISELYKKIIYYFLRPSFDASLLLLNENPH
jgi:hypothetical protein